MPTQEKIAKVAELKAILERASMVISTEYRGLSVKETIELRRRLREGNLDVRVVKNSLLKLAAEDSGNAALMEVVEGPTALAIAYEDIIEAAKAISDYAKSAPSAFGVRGAYMDGTVLTRDDVESLTKIPPKDVLVAQIAGNLQSPLSGLVALLNAPLQELVGLMESLLRELPGLINARIQQIEANPELGPKAAAEPASEEGSAEEASEEAPAAEAAGEEPTAEEKPAEKAAGEEPAEETSPEASTEEAAAEEAAEEEPPAEEETPAEEPAADEPAAEEETTEETKE